MDSQVLISMGMNKKAASVYLAALALGTASIQDIARKAGIKRPTAYGHVGELLEQGFLEKVPYNKRFYYRAAELQSLEDRLERNLSDLRRALPELTALRPSNSGKPNIRMLEGRSGIESIYGEMVSAPSLRFWSNLGSMQYVLHESYTKISEAIKSQGISAREIIADTKESRRFARTTTLIAGPTYAVRAATVGGITNDTIIYNDIVAIFRLHEFNMFVVRIEDKTIADTMRAIFEMSWRAAKPLRRS